MTSKPTSPRYRRYSSETRAAMLIEAGLSCLAKWGIAGFNFDRICAEANVSRGLLTHHFGSKDAFLAACYSAMYDRFTTGVTSAYGSSPSLVELVEMNFSQDVFNPDNLRIWLALWGQIAVNPELQAVHRKRYQDFLKLVAQAVEECAQSRGVQVNAQTIAVLFVALIDGLWLEQAIDPTMLSREAARLACYDFLEEFLGPLAKM
ncbi:TetR family transcriptional regulator C-terminal domain-containing protein [Xinfangfangia sp. CPCC 101601]|uniref:TetR family transcriptional regulator C-terminal domain-containing protein n=1 Tax=Pseudogemmobacter lacusdianii TaxID=3069608 RepID=A0ABU0W0U5_9RHOB|nr:TetR family transcriptional regulator C-terminal domain-containing protein [Xinfangfangia sp. CPCC 101601]MDQ2067623.1 TetR family transcriptional regulator C-terminal domain-containing protein [Xinfangfangia sp. CPCC 101601]